MIDFGFTALHAVVYACIFSAFVLATLYMNPRLWVQDYPRSIQEKVPSKDEAEKRGSLILSLFFVLIFAGYPLATLLLYRGAPTFAGAFLHLFVMFQFSNLIDLVILDWLIFCTITPQWLVIPGTTVDDGYKDYRYHFIAGLKGVVITTVAALVVAGVYALLA